MVYFVSDPQFLVLLRVVENCFVDVLPIQPVNYFDLIKNNQQSIRSTTRHLLDNVSLDHQIDLENFLIAQDAKVNAWLFQIFFEYSKLLDESDFSLANSIKSQTEDNTIDDNHAADYSEQTHFQLQVKNISSPIYNMFFRSIAHIQTQVLTLLPTRSRNFYQLCTFTERKSYQDKKRERQLQKSRQNFIPDSSSLVSSQILIQALVPGFFTNQLTLQKLPQRKIVDQNVNYFQNSYSRITLPLSTKPKLRQRLNKLFDKEVRIGRIFQLMDSIAGIVSYSHCHAGFTPGQSEHNQMACVTGSVQLLQLFHKIDIEKDLTIEGYLTHVGRTSMEIEINVLQENKLRANSLFTMIARSLQNQSKGYQVPSLSFEGLPPAEFQKAKIRLQHGNQNVIRRKKQMESSYDRTHPSLQDIKQIHSLFLKRQKVGTIQQDSSNPISKTIIETTEIMHTQQRNIHGKVFGGFLIRNMIELAWVAGCKYAEDFVVMEDLTNIYFKKPVDVGCRLTLKATVTYVEGNRLVTTVEAFTSKFTQKTQTLACYMHLISKSSKEMKKVHPQSYGQSLQYLSSRRAFCELFY